MVDVVSSQSWLARLKGAFGGIVVGLIMTVAAFPLHTWNEKQSVRRARALKEVGKEVQTVDAGVVNPENEQAVVHFSGRAETTGQVQDEVFGISESALKLNRKVEVYQWQEDRKTSSEKKLGGGTETVTTYTYRKVWGDELHSSSSFYEKEGHENPTSKAFPDHLSVAEPISVGAFTLPGDLIKRLSQWESYPLTQLEGTELQDREHASLIGGVAYLGATPATPTIGDTRISFEWMRPHEVTIVAQQVGQTLEPFISKKGKGQKVGLLKPGVFSAESMVTMAREENKMRTWIFRFVFFILMAIGLSLCFRPLSVLADVLPMAGSVIGAGTGIVAFLLAAILSFVTIAVAWLAFRPEISIPLIILAAAVGFFLVRRLKANRLAPA